MSNITVTLTQEQAQAAIALIEAGIEDRSEYFNNPYALQDGYTEQEIQEAEQSCDRARNASIVIQQALDTD